MREDLSSEVGDEASGGRWISIRGARHHNLGGFDLEIPLGALTVLTGPSGSGKTSLGFHTIHAEAYRRFTDALSVRSRKLLERLPRPRVDWIEGLTPSVALRQNLPPGEASDTVATLSELADYFSLIFAHFGVAYCPSCDAEMRAWSPSDVAGHVMTWPEKTRFMVLAPLDAVLVAPAELSARGFVRLRISGEVYELDSGAFDAGHAGAEALKAAASEGSEAELVIDRLSVRDGVRARLVEAVELSFAMTHGRVRLETSDGDTFNAADHPRCDPCGIAMPALTPEFFSSQHPRGACSACDGRGVAPRAAEDPGAPESTGETCRACLGMRLQPSSTWVQARLGGAMFTLADFQSLSIDEGISAIDVPFRGGNGKDGERDRSAVHQKLLAAIGDRLRMLSELGLGYLAMNRSGDTLSSGESHRIRVARAIAGELSGVTYVLDEPSSGLHPHDFQALLRALRRVVTRGSSVIAIEHSPRLVTESDYIVELGPGAGPNGGRVLAAGPSAELLQDNSDTSARIWSGPSVSAPAATEDLASQWISLSGASLNNLRDCSVRFLRAGLTCVSGVSGSGKSSLVFDSLLPLLRNALDGSAAADPVMGELSGAVEGVEKVIAIDSTPIGRSPRSCPATYMGLLDDIRSIYAGLPESRTRGYRASRFSFNVKGGRCEACQGQGAIRLQMHFLADEYVACTSCDGRRFNEQTLGVRYRGYDIAQLLALSADDAISVLAAIPKISKKLESLRRVGLGYLGLDRGAQTLSGGEAQRLKLARELSRGGQAEAVYLLDEPTRGLHPTDADALIRGLRALADDGHTLVMTDHQMSMIAGADHVIDLGPGPGPDGGRVLYEGPPYGLLAKSTAKSVGDSVTGIYLREYQAQKDALRRREA